MIKTDDATIAQILDRGTVDVIGREKLEKQLRSGKQLRVKLGIDPTKPDIHLGHTVALRKLRHFQDAGHQVVLLFGGFTATIGDPTGKDDARPALTLEDVQENADCYKDQAAKVLDMSKVELVNNRDWFGKMTPSDFIGLMGQFTVAQMMERDMFQERVKKGKPVYCHELLYPMLQGYDSVPIRADVEIGGTDQLFNMLQARPLQERNNMAPQSVMTVKLIEGTDGSEKMSKSLNNYIGLNDAPSDMFGKVMSIPDTIMGKYYECLTNEDLTVAEKEIQDNPRGAKIALGQAIVRWMHDDEAATDALKDFETKFVKKEIPDEMPEFKVEEDSMGVLDLITKVCNFANSNGDARRLVTGGGVTFDGEKVTDPRAIISFTGSQVLKVGKRKFGRIVK